MVVRQQMPERPEPDVPGERQRLGDEQVGRRARFPRGREMLSYPGLREAETVQALEFLQVPPMALEDRPLGRMRRHEEGTEFQPAVHACHRQSFPLPWTNSVPAIA